MSYLNQILQPNEQVVATGKKHWIIYLPGLLMLVVVVVLEALGVALPGMVVLLHILAALAGLTALALLFREWFAQWTTEIVVTNKRVIYKRGFISRYTSEMNTEKVESVAVDQTLPGRLFGYGTIDIRGTGAGLEQLKGIADPLRLRNAITIH